MPRPRVAVVTTTYFAGSHADCFITPLIEGYEWHGAHIDSRVEVASMYLEQRHPDDIGLGIAARNGVPVFDTVAEAMTCGGSGLQVDGVIIIGEHGEYEDNVFGQKLYPRRRLFDSALSCMVGAGRYVPIVNAWNFADALAMYDTCRRLGIPLLAGSTIPIAWRIPTGADWPIGEPMEEIVVVAFGGKESYGHHNLEALQVLAERRAGGEIGVTSVQALDGGAAMRAIDEGAISGNLLDRAFASYGLDEAMLAQVRASIDGLVVVTYADGLNGAIVSCGAIVNSWGIAASGPAFDLDCRMWVQPKPWRHALFFVRQFEHLMLTGTEPYPVERTLLTSGMLDALMHSLHDGGMTRLTPELTITYAAPAHVSDTGLDEPLPAGAIVEGGRITS